MKADANAERREQDLLGVRALAQRSAGKIRLLQIKGDPMHTVRLELRYRSALSPSYPRETADRAELTLTLADKYPHVAPKATLTPPLFHPHVYDSGLICLGSRWIGTEGLDQLVVRVIRIITFQPEMIDDHSPASLDALDWYRQHTGLFPTEQIPLALTAAAPPAKKKISWTPVSAAVPPERAKPRWRSR